MAAKPQEIGPWVPGAVSKRIIGFQTIITFCLLLAVIILALISWKLATLPPRLVTQFPNGQFATLDTQPIKITADDVINFIQSVIPRLYENSEGAAPGIEELRGLNVVNPNIVDGLLGDMQQQAAQMTSGHYLQSAIVQSVNRTSLAIRYSQKIVYAEATGVLILTDREGHSQTTPTQWAMLLYIKDIVDSHYSIVNRYGLYLQNIIPQTPGTANPDAPKPTGEEFGSNQSTPAPSPVPDDSPLATPTPAPKTK